MKNWKEIFMMALGSLTIIGILGCIVLLVLCEIPQGNKEALLLVLGVLTGAFITVVNYFFGSSKGSADKTQLLNKPTDEKL